MNQAIIFYYDFVSPYSFFAFSQRHEISQRTGRELELRPVSVGMVMEQVGNVPTSLTCAAKRAYQKQDLMRWAVKLGLGIKVHPAFGTFSTAPLIKAAIGAGDDVESFSVAAFNAIWTEQAPVTDSDAMHRFLGSKNAKFADYWAQRDDMSGALEQRVAEAVSDGVFGVPFFHTEIGSFFGNDRIDFLIEAMTDEQ